ncbi:MAG: tetratricopeptide repeat protein [Deltaproteobacteria bacterium]|nr:tetratricopeptide repeat protein [Deltaproteobacteria bacterium]
MSSLLWIAALALAAPVDALGPAAQTFYQEAARAESSGHLDEAARRYRMVIQLDPAFTQGRADLARVLRAQGRLDEALRAYRAAPFDAELCEGEASLLLQLGRRDEALPVIRRLAALTPESPVSLWLEARARAGEVGSAELLLSAVDHPARVADEGSDLAILSVLEGLAPGDPAAEALRIELLARWPELASREALVEPLERVRVEGLAARLLSSGAVPWTEEDRRRAVAAAALSGAEAVAAAEGVVARAPDSAASWALLAELQEREGALAAATFSWERAVALDPLDGAQRARLGDLLARAYGGRYDREARAQLEIAADLEPARPELWLRLGRLAQRLGDPEGASAAFLQYLALAPEGAQADEVRAEVRGLRRDRLPSPPTPALSALPDGDALHLAVAQVYLSEGRLDQAVEALAEVGAPSARSLNLEASIALQRGERGRAVALYRDSLARVPAQQRVWEVLLRLHRGGAVEALPVLEHVAAGGQGCAWVLLAEDAWSRGDEALTRERLALAGQASDPAWASRAAALEDALAARTRSRWRWGLGLGGGLGALLGLRSLWRWRGVSLEGLLTRAPRAWPEVAAVVAAIRHEVIRHNLSMLPALADALEQGEGEVVGWAAERLFGASGVIDRFDQSRRALEEVARVWGAPLNLSMRDPVFSLMIADFSALRSLEARIRRGDPSAAPALRTLGVRLSRDRAGELARLIRRAALLRVDGQQVQAAWERVIGEASLRHLAAPLLDLRDLTAGRGLVRVPPEELERMLVNLMRNALQASDVPVVGVSLEVEEDWVTGLESLVLAVCDHAQGTLSTGFLRSRFVSGGLGMTVDLVYRHRGSARVAPRAGWAKAVELRLPIAAEEEL